MTARRRAGAAVRALGRAARAWLLAHRDAHDESAWLWRYGPGLGPTAPIAAPAAPPNAARGAADRPPAP